MAGKIDAKLKELGITLPEAAAPVAAYVPAVLTGNLLVVSGQVTMDSGKLAYIGKVGAEFSLEEGKAAARLCALNILAQAKAALGGDLDRITRVVKLQGFVNCPGDFTQHPEVINGASELMLDVFGDAGRHARVALGAGSLPRGVACEVDAMFEVA